MDAINQNNLEIGMENIRRQRESADRALQRKIEENLKWLNESEGRAYVVVTRDAAERGQACVTKTLLGAMFRRPSRGEPADTVCQQSARDSLAEARYESLAHYRKASRNRPMRKGADNPDSLENAAARAYLFKRFEADLLALPATRREELRSLGASTEANMKLCADPGDALACHEMVTKPFMAAFKELFGGLERDKRHAEAAMATPAPSRPAVEPRVLPPMPKDLKLPEHGEYDPYATQKWTCKIGYVQVGDRCQKQ